LRNGRETTVGADIAPTAGLGWAGLQSLLRVHRQPVALLAFTSLIGGVIEALFLVVVTRTAFAVTDRAEEVGLVAGRSLSM
jgi:hypothetical protein